MLMKWLSLAVPQALFLAVRVLPPSDGQETWIEAPVLEPATTPPEVVQVQPEAEGEQFRAVAEKL